MAGTAQPSDFLLLRLRNLGRAADRRLAQRLADVGVSTDELQVLLAIQTQPGISAVEIAPAIDLDAPTVSRLVNGLVQRGLVVRRRSRSDRRVVRLRSASAAAELIAAGRAAAEAADLEFLDQLTPAERRALQRALDRLRSADSS